MYRTLLVERPTIKINAEFGLVLDRENNDGNYEPSNCRFVTQAVNGLNKSKDTA